MIHNNYNSYNPNILNYKPKCQKKYTEGIYDGYNYKNSRMLFQAIKFHIEQGFDNNFQIHKFRMLCQQSKQAINSKQGIYQLHTCLEYLIKEYTKSPNSDTDISINNMKSVFHIIIRQPEFYIQQNKIWILAFQSANHYIVEHMYKHQIAFEQLKTKQIQENPFYQMMEYLINSDETTLHKSQNINNYIKIYNLYKNNGGDINKSYFLKEKVKEGQLNNNIITQNLSTMITKDINII